MKTENLRVRASSAERPVFRAEKRRINADGVEMTLIGVEAQLVPNTAYYRKQIAKGDLVLVEAASTPNDPVEDLDLEEKE